MAAPRYLGTCMVDPRGTPYFTSSHPTWAADNKDLLRDGNVSDDDALNQFIDEGWVRVKPSVGVTVAQLDSGTTRLVKRIVRDLACTTPNRTLWVDVWGDSKRVPVDGRGRPDFSELVEEER